MTIFSEESRQLSVSRPTERLRRLRATPALRRFARETSLSAADFILPLFVRHDGERRAIPSMEGHFQETMDTLPARIEEALALGVTSVILFGIPTTKSPDGHEAWAPNGVVQDAIRTIRKVAGRDMVILADCCLDEYTSHGHCGVMVNGEVDNDATLALYTLAAQSQAHAGADVIAPSGMMDGGVAAIRDSLDEMGFSTVAIASYAAKFASCLYGPFRDAAGSTPQYGDRHGYQMDVANGREAQREITIDMDEGADAIIVKPALSSLDIIALARPIVDRPLIGYSVSGEWAFVHHASAAGAFDRRTAAMEMLMAIRRAGADRVITYFALEAAQWLKEER